ncbi:thioredoxin fold domain-containing protein [Sphingobacterium sp. LRF_L2]|uniref:thioredoxin family protein n=1 Tax=Sphingobacterium sp. LRF_L2 TaxID=3369421 RepID=UPI003F5DA0F9
MKQFLFTLLMIPFLAFAQDKGITFEHHSTWDKIKAKAKAENKYIFVDCFTTWCGPCKYMSSTIFPQEEVGNFFNANFVNLKLQMDETKDDNDEVKSWYNEAKRFAIDYAVRAYPTFLIFNPQGELVHRIIGGGEANVFIAKAKEGLNPETQYVTLVKKFEQEPSNAAVAKNMAKAALSAYDQETAQRAIAKYMTLVGPDSLLTTDNIQFLLQGATSSSSPAFLFIKNNKEKVDVLLTNKGVGANEILSNVLNNEFVIPKIRSNQKDIDFVAIKNQIEKEHPGIDMTTALARSKSQYYLVQKNWPAFKDAVNEFVNSKSKNISPAILNDFAWAVFENCDDASCLQAALNWSKTSLENNNNPAFIDTYANLLYKSGDKENAIKWQEKAVERALESEKGAYTATLDKMKRGEQTW